MLSQEKFNKLSKYASRLEKSFVKNNSSDYMKYCSHLKYHIGGEGTNTKLDEMFKGLIDVINADPTYKLEPLQKKVEIATNILEPLKKQRDELQEEKDKLQTEFDTSKNTIEKLEKEKNELEETKNVLTNKIDKYNKIKETIELKLEGMSGVYIDDMEYVKKLEEGFEAMNEKIKNAESKCVNNDELINSKNEQIEKFKENIELLTKKINELEGELTKVKQDNDETIAKANQDKDEAIAKVNQDKDEAIEKIKTEDVETFRNKLEEIIKLIYGVSIAQTIMNKISVNDTQDASKT